MDSSFHTIQLNSRFTALLTDTITPAKNYYITRRTSALYSVGFPSGMALHCNQTKKAKLRIVVEVSECEKNFARPKKIVCRVNGCLGNDVRHLNQEYQSSHGRCCGVAWCVTCLLLLRLLRTLKSGMIQTRTARLYSVLRGRP